MRRLHLSPTLSIRATLVFLALVVSAMALVILGTKPAESQQAPAQPLYTVHELGTLGGSWSAAYGINDTDEVVGGTGTVGDAEERAYLYRDGQMSDLGTLGGSYSVGLGINNADEVVGYFDTGGDAGDHAFLYSDGVMRDLNSLIPEDSNLVLSSATAINDSGHIVGIGSVKGEMARLKLSF
jgi:probable HAF family extracellular repeat protein